MKVNGTGGIDPLKAYTAHIKAQKPEAGEKKEKPQEDKLEISAGARRFQDYLARLEKVPGVREDLVASLKKRIQDGTYQPDSKKIASGILAERLMDRMERKD